MADGKLKRYLVSGEVRFDFTVEVEAETEGDAEEQVTDMSHFELAEDSGFEDIDIFDVECLDEEEDDET